MKRTASSIFIIALLTVSLAAQDRPADQESRKQAAALRIGNERVRVDGRLDEPAWTMAPAIEDFVQKEPTEGAAPTERTEVRFLYDEDALYVGARLYKRPGASIQAPMGRRDRGEQAEHILVALDTFLDRRTAYVFGVTASGVRIDRYHSRDDENDYEEEYEPVWQARTSIDEQGWTAELWIPFSQLRFNNQQQHVWGLNVHRFTPTLNEDDYWAPIPRTIRAWSSRFGELRGIEGLPSTRRLELLPYVAGSSTINSDRDPANPFDDGRNLASRGGADIKMGIGPNLTLDATFNPDFGQVEADPAEVNLSAFETRFAEKRPFFTEGADLLNTPVMQNYFYSRRIGAPPAVAVAGDFVNNPPTTTILGAAKLTGRLRPNTTIGVLGAVTGEETARTFNRSTSTFGRTRVAARTTFGSARVVRQFGANQSTVGGMFTFVHRDLPDEDPLGQLLVRNAMTVEGDATLRFRGGEYDLTQHASGTLVRGEEAAIARVQRSSAHFAQRPDRGYHLYDPTLTSLRGYDAGLVLRRTGGAHWIWTISNMIQSPRWETNDIGRLTANDSLASNFDIRYRQTTPGRIFRGYWIGLDQNNDFTYGLDRQVGSAKLYSSQTWHNFWTTAFGYTSTFRTEDVRLTRGGPTMQTPRGWTAEALLKSRPSGETSWSGQVFVGGTEDGGLTNRFIGHLTFRPGARWQLSIDPNLLRQVDTQQYISTLNGGRAETYGRRYVFGTVDRSTYSMQFRLGYTLKPDVNVDVYAEPFAASGRYSNLGELALPRTRQRLVYGTGGTTAAPQADGGLRVTAGSAAFNLANNEFNVRSFRSNVVLRWEYRPGSTFYVVWQQNRRVSEVDANRVSLVDPFRSLTAPGAQYFVVKTSYWLPFR